MTDRPIIFTGAMARAILDGRKTQTRRIAKIKAIMGNRVSIGPHEELIELIPGEFRQGVMHYASTAALSGPYPVGYAVGDRLWVRETWAKHYRAASRIYQKGEFHPWGSPIYKSTFSAMMAPKCEGFTAWKSPSNMPRWASRITLIVEDVRVQRLQDINYEDAVAEGVTRSMRSKFGFVADPSEETFNFTQARSTFGMLWDSANAKRGYGWEQNPWVIALTFRPIFHNIDAKEAAE